MASLAVVLALEAKSSQRELTSRLLAQLVPSVLSCSDLETSLDQLLRELPDLVLDTPGAPQVSGPVDQGHFVLLTSKKARSIPLVEVPNLFKLQSSFLVSGLHPAVDPVDIAAVDPAVDSTAVDPAAVDPAAVDHALDASPAAWSGPLFLILQWILQLIQWIPPSGLVWSSAVFPQLLQCECC